MIQLRHPGFFLRSFGLAVLACSLASCSGAGGLKAGLIVKHLKDPAPVTRVESGDAQPTSRHSERGRRVRLGLGAGSVW
jgi:hypothetical protein